MATKKKAEIKTVGRPKMYDHAVILTHLKKNAGTAGGLAHAWTTLKKLKGYEKLSYPTLCNVARANGINFKAGKPPVVVQPKKKKPKKEVVAEPVAA